MHNQKEILSHAEKLLTGLLDIVRAYNNDDILSDDSINQAEQEEAQPQKEERQKEEGYLNFKDMCDFLGIAESTGYQRIARGEILNFKKGRRLYFKQSDLIKYIESGRRKTAEDLDAIAQKHLQNFNRRK